MRKSLAVALIAGVVGTVALVVWPHLPVHCSAGNRLDQLLGGGPAICLGGNSAQLDRYSNENPDDSSCDLVQRDQGGEYWYAAQRNTALCKRSGPVVTGCVTLRNGTKAVSLARSATTRMGGQWRVTIITTQLGLAQQLWTSSEGMLVSNTVSFDGRRTVCVEDKRLHAWNWTSRNGG